MENILITETELNLNSEGLPLNSPENKAKSPIFPVYKDFIPLSCPSEKIFKAFEKICKENQFKVSVESSYKLTAVLVQRFSIKRLLSCITGEDQRDVITRVELQIKIMAPNKKMIIAQGLQGCITKQAVLINSFKSELGKILTSRELLYNDLPNLQRVQGDIASYLASEAGRSAISELAQSLSQSFEIKKIKASVVEVIKKSFNHHPISAKSMYLKTLEQFVFTKFSQNISEHYLRKTEEKQRDFSAKTKRLLEKSNKELFELLLFKEKYRLKNDPNPYSKPIDLLKTLSKKQVPVAKLDTLYEVHILIRTTVFEYWKGRVELESMDDILPIYIFIIIKSDFPSLPADIEMLEDYIKISQDMESEERLIVNYHVAIQYIQNECF